MGQVFVRASRRARAYVRRGRSHKVINNMFKRQARIAGTLNTSSREAGALQLKRYSLNMQLPGQTVKARRLTARKRLHAKQLYNGTYR